MGTISTKNQEENGITRADILATKPDCLAAAAALAKADTVAIGKTKLEFGRMFALAIMAGMQIGLGALFMTFVKADHSLSFAASSVLGGLCFTVGLICVIVAGAELFTGNCLMVIGASNKKIAWIGVLKNWVIVWIGNLAGSLILVAIVVGCGLMTTKAGDNTIGNQMVAVAAGKINLEALEIFCRAILCNFLVCLAVWMGFCGRTVIDKIFTSIIPVMSFVAMGFEHSVANMFFLPMGTIASQSGFGDVVLTWGGVFYNLTFATLGNIVGGSIFVGMIYWIAYRSKASAK